MHLREMALGYAAHLKKTIDRDIVTRRDTTCTHGHPGPHHPKTMFCVHVYIDLEKVHK